MTARSTTRSRAWDTKQITQAQIARRDRTHRLSGAAAGRHSPALLATISKIRQMEQAQRAALLRLLTRPA